MHLVHIRKRWTESILKKKNRTNECIQRLRCKRANQTFVYMALYGQFAGSKNVPSLSLHLARAQVNRCVAHDWFSPSSNHHNDKHHNIIYYSPFTLHYLCIWERNIEKVCCCWRTTSAPYWCSALHDLCNRNVSESYQCIVQQNK